MFRFAFPLAVAATCAASAAHSVPLYVFDSLVEATPGAPGGADPINRRPSIADDGAVVFAERYLDGSTVRERIRVVTEDGTSRIVADEASLPIDLHFATNPVISDDGTYVSFVGADAVGPAVWRADLSAATPTYTRIVREGDVIPGVAQVSGSATLVTVEGLNCGTGCAVASATGTGPDGQVIFRTNSAPAALSVGNGGETSVLSNDNPSTIVHVHQSDSGQVVYSYNSLPEILYFTGAQVSPPGFAVAGSSSSVPQYWDFSDVAIEANAVSPPTTTYVAVASRKFGDFSKVIYSNAQDELVNSDDAFEDFRDVSVNKARNLLFIGDLDIGGSGIFNGPDAALNRVIGPGDVVFGKVVTSVGIQKAEALNEDDDVTLWVELDDGSQHILRGQTLGDFFADLKAQISLPGGQTSLSQFLDDEPDTVFGIEVGLDFLAGTSVIDINFAGVQIASVREQSLTDGVFRLMGIDPNPFQRALLAGADPILEFLVNSNGSAAVRIDNVSLLDQLGNPLGIVKNGNFETGYLDDWVFDGPDGANVFAKAVATTPVPPPAPALLLLTALCLTAGFGRRRRGFLRRH